MEYIVLELLMELVVLAVVAMVLRREMQGLQILEAVVAVDYMELIPEEQVVPA